ncbi:hypothetical protein CRG98_046822 [Punica granatum]|uniref:Reverse transcriptase Ty1/copia-type domain-containing protein n=1 Tax=Punica granatum TaxID=22663 RepID=A0A2I0HM56_PUNGR|nr:hypothetical protein CRG98_046822 [Punica granatum]
MHQLDVHNAFLHGELEEEVYMKLPPGFSHRRPGYACRLQKSLYGLRQASRNWFSKFTSALRNYGFSQSEADHSLFTLQRDKKFLAVLVYVDDMIVVGNSSEDCTSLKRYLDTHFRIKDLGSLKYFLGIEVTRMEKGLFLNQRKYALDIINECGLLGSKPSYFPMEQRHGLSSDSGSPISKPTRYRRLIGRLIYLTITRPELSYSVHILSHIL